MGKIGVVVTKAVDLDRDGARSLLRAFADWANREPLQGTGYGLKQQDVDKFLSRYDDVEVEHVQPS